MGSNKQQQNYKITCIPSEKRSSECKFWLGDLSSKDIQEIVMYIVQEKNPGALRKNVRNLYFNCKIENNDAKLVIEYDTAAKHVQLRYTVDAYGVVEDKYIGWASDCLRGVMREKFGTEYENALIEKFGEKAVALD